MARQPNRGMMSVPSSAAAGKPVTTKTVMKPSHLPRDCGGTNSVSVEYPTTFSAPSPNPMIELDQNQNLHGGREGGGDGCKSENGKIRLIGEAPPVAVAQEAGHERSQHHPDKSCRNKLRILAERGKSAFDRRSENDSCKVNIEAVEKHSRADQPHDPAMEGGQRQPVEPRSRVYRHGSLTSLPREHGQAAHRQGFRGQAAVLIK